MERITTTADVDRARLRRSGLAAVVGGVAFVVGALGSAALDALWIAVLVGIVALVYAVPGLHRHQAPGDGLPGRWGAVLVRAGGGLMVVLGLVFLTWEAVGDPPDSGPALVDVAWMLGFVGFVLGVALFAIGSLRAKVLPVASGVLVLVGILSALAIDLATGAFFEDDPGTTAWGFHIGITVLGLGLAWAGYSVLRTVEARPARAAAVV